MATVHKKKTVKRSADNSENLKLLTDSFVCIYITICITNNNICITINRQFCVYILSIFWDLQLKL